MESTDNMNYTNRSSQEILNKSIEDRLEYFSNFIIRHPKLSETTEQVLRTIKNASGFSLFMVLGPSGVGKTTLRTKVEQIILTESYAEMEEDKSYIPIASMEAVSPDSGKFNWKDYYKRALEALQEPLISCKINYDEIIKNRQTNFQLKKINNSRTSPELRKSLENAFFYRNTKVFMIDEAQHFAKMSSGRRLQDQLDTIKSLSNVTGVVHILIGTYELIPFVNLSAQLSRRTIDIHFPRYNIENQKDVYAFQSIINTFQNIMPLEEKPDLINHWKFIYERTIGCVGIMKNWLERCLVDALHEKKKTIDIDLLRKHSLSVSKVEKMAIEAIEGESIFKEDKEKIKRLKFILGLSSFNIEEEQFTTKSKRSTKVGQRKPNRDKTGMI